MNIIEKVRSILEDFPRIGEVCGGLHVDFAEPEPTSYGLSSVGDTLISEDILGRQIRQHTFMLYSTFSGYNDFERLSNSSALLELALWLKEQTGGEVVSIIGDNEYSGEITELRAENGMIYDVPQENAADGVQYQLQIIAKYTIET